MGLIYCFTHKESGKKYVGQTVFPSMDKRLKEHLNDCKRKKSKFHKYLNKYGFDGFHLDILETVDDNTALDDREDHWIRTYNTVDRNVGLNLRFGGSHGAWSEEVKQKISNTKKGVRLTEEHKRKISISGRLLGRKQSEYQKLRCSQTHSKQWQIQHPDGTVENIVSLLAFCKPRKLNPSNLTIYGHTKGYRLIKQY